MKWLLTGAVLVAGCTHTAVPTAVGDRASGPLNGTDIIALSAGGIRWSSDGASLIATATRIPIAARRNEPRRIDTLDTCILRMPPTGGSATWEYCITRGGERDSSNVLHSPAMGPDGRVLYVEYKGGTGLHIRPPLDWEADLWVQDTSGSSRRHLLTLYRNGPLGQVLVLPDSVNWLDEMTWLDATRFVAIGYNRHPAEQPEAGPTLLGPVAGTIGNTGATLRRIPVASDTRIIGADRGDILLEAEPGTIIRFDPASWTVKSTTQLGLAPGRAVASASCGAGFCYALAVSQITPDGQAELRVVRFYREGGTVGSVGTLFMSYGGVPLIDARAGRVVSGQRLAEIPFPLP